MFSILFLSYTWHCDPSLSPSLTLLFPPFPVLDQELMAPWVLSMPVPLSPIQNGAFPYFPVLLSFYFPSLK